MNHKFPSFSQWKQIFKVLKRGEKILLLAFLPIAIGSLVFLITNFYLENTKTVSALGSSYKEGIIGQPGFINPVYGETNDIDRTLIGLVFSGLMAYDNQGRVTKDLAEDYKVSDDGKTYEFWLKDEIFWHDGKKLSADDVIFTIKTIQNSDYKSPLRANWIDVEVEKISDKSLRFKLKSPYNSFLENCTVGIIPKHIWEKILPQNFAFSSYNLQPIGSGPFKIKRIEQANDKFIKKLDLESNRKYYRHPSFISNISFIFFENREELVKAAKAGQIDGFSLNSLENNESLLEKEINQGKIQNRKFLAYYFSLPRYFAVFFNEQKSPLFSDKNVRKAFVHSVNKEELGSKINPSAQSKISLVDSPILPQFFNYSNPSKPYQFDIDLAKNLLDKAGFKEINGQRRKDVKKEPAFQFKNYLKVGSKGTEVTQLQSCLISLGDNFKNILKEESSANYTKITEQAVNEFQKKYLPESNPTGETGANTRKKLNELCLAPNPDSQPLKFTLVTINQTQLVQTANILKDYWLSLGALVDIKAVPTTEIKTIIKERNYDALLYGQALGAEIDLYPFWHSSQKIDPGLNLSSYENKDVDLLLKEARETQSSDVKKQNLEKLQDIIISEAPALFLYNPDYTYWVSKKVRGMDAEKIIDPAKRFSNITEWYIKTKRVWK